MHIRKSMCKKVEFCLEVREGSDLLRVHNGFIGYLDFPVITPLPLAEDMPKICHKFRDLKECDGTHSEHIARKVPTLRNQRKHRTKWEIYGISMGFQWLLCLILY